jgi:hypothetical protein
MSSRKPNPNAVHCYKILSGQELTTNLFMFLKVYIFFIIIVLITEKKSMTILFNLIIYLFSFTAILFINW